MEIIDVNKKIFENKKTLEIENEVIVPDVKPDMVNIICTNGLCYVTKKEITDGIAKISGNVETTVVYLSSDVGTKSLQAVLDFNYKVQDNLIKEGDLLKYNVKIKEINSRILNERKISINVILDIELKFYEKQEVKFYNEFKNIEDLQKQEEILKLNSVIGIGATKASLDEKIDVNNMDNIAEILKTDINIQNVESKSSFNKILAKAEVQISLIYLTEDERIGTAKAIFPVMSFVQIPNVKEEDLCNLDYQINNIILKIANGDEKGVNCQIEFDITAEVFEQKEIKIITDLYSLKNDLEVEQDEIQIEVNNEDDPEIVKIDEKIEIDGIKSVFSVDEKLNLSESPEVQLTIYYENNEKSGLNVKTVNIPVIAKSKGKNYNIKLKNKEFDVSDNKVIVQMEFEVSTVEEFAKTIPLIKEVQIKETENKEDYSVVVYFVKQNDTIWKIAKKFKVTVDSLVKINDLENPDLIYPGDKLYVLK